MVIVDLTTKHDETLEPLPSGRGGERYSPSDGVLECRVLDRIAPLPPRIVDQQRFQHQRIAF